MVGDGENEGRPESRSRRSASVHGAFPELLAKSAAISWAEIDPTKVLGAEKESMVSLYGPRRRKSPEVSSVEEWWRMGQEGGAVEPTQVDARRGKCAVCASVERSRW